MRDVVTGTDNLVILKVLTNRNLRTLITHQNLRTNLFAIYVIGDPRQQRPIGTRGETIELPINILLIVQPFNIVLKFSWITDIHIVIVVLVVFSDTLFYLIIPLFYRFNNRRPLAHFIFMCYRYPSKVTNGILVRIRLIFGRNIDVVLIVILEVYTIFTHALARFLFLNIHQILLVKITHMLIAKEYLRVHLYHLMIHIKIGFTAACPKE